MVMLREPVFSLPQERHLELAQDWKFFLSLMTILELANRRKVDSLRRMPIRQKPLYWSGVNLQRTLHLFS
jgi:hypothetical protein